MYDHESDDESQCENDDHDDLGPAEADGRGARAVPAHGSAAADGPGARAAPAPELLDFAEFGFNDEDESDGEDHDDSEAPQNRTEQTLIVIHSR